MKRTRTCHPKISHIGVRIILSWKLLRKSWLNGYEFEQPPGACEGHRSLTCCSSWGHKESGTTEQPNNNKTQEELSFHFLPKSRRYISFLQRKYQRKFPFVNVSSSPLPGVSVQIWRQHLSEMTGQQTCLENPHYPTFLSHLPTIPSLHQNPQSISYKKSIIHTLSCFVKMVCKSPHISHLGRFHFFSVLSPCMHMNMHLHTTSLLLICPVSL